ncbi:hypothetical protein LCGC14_0163880 [marine sediment metagenome]|uniref:Uncharacterized protein n=1 Tax=marine sediment metagenome TaxID=412755 RepID=A0A0F9UYE6_9ZZZZ
MKSYKDVTMYLAKLNMPQHQGMIVVLAEGDIGARMRINEWCMKRGYPVPQHFTSMCKPKGEGECSMVRMSPDEFGVCAVKMEPPEMPNLNLEGVRTGRLQCKVPNVSMPPKDPR